MPCDRSLSMKKRGVKPLFSCLAEGNVRCKAFHSSARKPTISLLASLSHSPSRLKPGRMGSGLPHPLRGFEPHISWPQIKKKRCQMASLFLWRRARDSNPTFAMAGIVENTGLQRLVKMSVFKSVFKKSPAGLCVLFIQNA